MHPLPGKVVRQPTAMAPNPRFVPAGFRIRNADRGLIVGAETPTY
jgi:hypothetical protein